MQLNSGAVGLLASRNVSQLPVVNVEEVLKVGDRVNALVLDAYELSRVMIAIKPLERTPGDMLRDPQLVFDGAEEMAAAFRESKAKGEEEEEEEDAEDSE